MCSSTLQHILVIERFADSLLLIFYSLKIGVISASFQSSGSLPCITEAVNTRTSGGAIYGEVNFNKLAGMLSSGPVALCGSSSCSSFLTPSV